MIKLKTYKVFSTLLLYPSEELKNNIKFVTDILKQEDILSIEYIDKLSVFIEYIEHNDLLFLQESYVALFDRQKQFSLYLFEHIHGDSRDRGMAMVDLKNLYKTINFDIPLGGELPDFIPVFLEYLSVVSRDKACILLSEIVNIIAIIGNRLKNVNSIYYIIFFALESLSSVKSDDNVLKKAILNNNSDKISDQNVDKNWEDTKVF